MKKFDTLFKKVELFERLAVYGDRKSFLQALAQDATSWEDEARREGDVPEDHRIPPPSPETPASPVAAPTAPVAPAGGPSVSPSELTGIQNYLNKVMLDKWPPVNPDGKWGPETARIVAQWAKANKLNLSMQQLIESLKSRAMGQGVTNSVSTGPEFDLAKKYL
jgi:hypothetical protein